MPQSQQVLYSKLRPCAIIHGNPMRPFILRLGLAVNEYGWYPYMIETLPVLGGDTGRCHKNSINAPSMKGFNDFHLLVRIIVSSTEQNAEATNTSYFFDTLDNITKKRVVNRCHYQTYGTGAPRLQALRNSVGRIAHLLRQA